MLNGWTIVSDRLQSLGGDVQISSPILTFKCLTHSPLFIVMLVSQFFIIKAWKWMEETRLKRRWNKTWICQISCDFSTFYCLLNFERFQVLSINSTTFLSKLPFFALYWHFEIVQLSEWKTVTVKFYNTYPANIC